MVINFKIVLPLCTVLFCSCSTGLELTNKNEINMDTELFDLSFNEKHKNENSSFYQNVETRKDGTEILTTRGSDRHFTINIIEPPFLLVQVKEFNEFGKLKKKGLLFGECPIGKWLECDENGENCKIVDYEEGRGRFSYNDVFNFLKKKKFIKKNPKIPEDQESFDVEYSYEQNTWTVKACYLPNPLGYYHYELDGDTGDILKEEYISTIY